MQNNRIAVQTFKFITLLSAVLTLLACGGGQAPESLEQPPSEPAQQLPQAGMHIYKDPVTGEFVSQPPRIDKHASQVMPQGLQQLNKTEAVDSSVAETAAEEYESPVDGGGMLLDLPPPYSEIKE